MGGPSVAVLLQKAPAMRPLSRIIASIGTDVTALGAERHFWMLNTDVLGVPSTGEVQGCRFSLYLDTEHSDPGYYEDCVLELLDLLGYTPEAVVTLEAWCNRPVDHRLLGALALYLAEQFGGVIDLGSKVSPPRPGIFGEKVSIEEVRAYTKQIGGTALECWPADRESFHHIVDVVFLRAWLSHPNFHIVK